MRDAVVRFDPPVAEKRPVPPDVLKMVEVDGSEEDFRLSNRGFGDDNALRIGDK